MHSHIETGMSIAADTVNRIIQLDALLGHADEDDRAELAERLAALDPAELKHILATFGVQPSPSASVTVAVSDAGDEKAGPSHV